MAEITYRLSGVILDNLWFWAFICLLTLLAFLGWSFIELHDHFYFATQPFSTFGVPIK